MRLEILTMKSQFHTNCPNQQLQIIVIDDDVDVANLILRALNRTGLNAHMHTASNGREGLDLLGRLRSTVDCPNFLVLLDFDMPVLNGIEFLDELRSHPDLGNTVVFALTASDDERDIAAAYDRNIAGYLQKSEIGSDFSGVVQMIDVFSKYVAFPSQSS